MGDGAQVLLELVGRHADAGIGDGDGPGVFVEGDADLELVLAELDVLVGQAAEIQLVYRVGRIRDELAEEDLAIGVDGVDHEVEELLALRLEFAHRVGPFRSGRAARANCPRAISSLGLRVLKRDCSTLKSQVKEGACGVPNRYLQNIYCARACNRKTH